jgi:LacI family transcriptional regulator
MANLEIPLTSVGVPINQIAHNMVHTLLSLIKANADGSLAKTLKPIVTERVSCAQVANRKV